MIVGEAPGNDEDRDGKPFMGAAGRLLADLLRKAGIPLTDIFLTNVVRCHPPKNRAPKPDEIINCRDYLIEEIKQKNPKVIITVGATALAALYKRMPLTGVLGQVLVQPDTGIPIVPTYHPAFLIRGQWNKADLVVAHLEKALRVARGQLGPQDLEAQAKNWHSITTLDKLRQLRDYLLSDEVRVIALDTETTGLSWMDDELLCISFSALTPKMKAVRHGWTVPLGAQWPGNVEEQDEVTAIVGEILASDKEKSIQNAGFDIKLLERKRGKPVSRTVTTAYGFTINNLAYDPMLLQRLVNENLPANETVMLALYTDLPYYEDEIKTQTGNKKHMEKADPKLLWRYAAADADGLARLTEVLVRLAEKEGVRWLHDEISIPMVRACWAMTERGVPVDMEYFVQLCDRYEVLGAEALEACWKAAGREFNPNAPADIQQLLFKELGLPKSGRKTGKAADCQDCDTDACDIHDVTGKLALQEIKKLMEEAGDTPHPILDAILYWKEINKRKSTYVNGKDGEHGLLQFIRLDGGVHPEYTVNRADTGRLNAVKPPIQTIPKNVVDEVLGTNKQLRRIFAAPPGRTMMELDWSQGEVWVMAYASGDKTLMGLLKEGKDVHTYVARQLASFNMSDTFPAEIEEPELSDSEWKKKYDAYRTKAKVFVFGLDYGMTAVGAAQRLGCSIEDADQLVEAFLSRVFPSLREHFAKVRREMEIYGTLKNTFGRIGHFGEYDLVRPFGMRGHQYWEGRFRKGVNMPIQSGLNDLHQLVHPVLENDPVIRERFKIVTAVHDSLLGLVKGDPYRDKDYMIQTAWMLKEKAETMAKTLILPDGTPLGWEIPVEVQWGQSWGNLNWTLGADGYLKEPDV